MRNKAISQIRFEIQQIEQLFETYSGLLERVRRETPGMIEITAIASVMHSFYNGLENIFRSIAREIDADIPTGDRWHRDILTKMTESTDFRDPILSHETFLRLTEYLAFRHFYRHSYSFILEWDELEKLVIPLPEVWEQVKHELHAFLDTLIIGTP
ncbi:hypothetical protein U27_01009 [Candidatus Vecturithrix granuli]|uniref:HepT-like domain-containing protein n=1 Tax=Vecturithrix granuli TaxID=1499967 RepID=A0A081C956_VECG1|nr:hypothetical protein U27_01009 [Candidatus Vecturithrix granuli]